MHLEEKMWNSLQPHELWAMDKLILSRHLGYICGPTGTSVPKPGWYCVRPCVNAFGMGLQTQKIYIEDRTDHLPPGHFWCEWFNGRHLSVDYEYGRQKLCVEGIRQIDDFIKWEKWVKTNDIMPLPDLIKKHFYYHRWLNCEFIGTFLIEIHFRYNTDFRWGNSEYIPVWDENQKELPGYEYIPDPEPIVGRIGALIR